jgi:hypothetical protein
MGPFRTSDNKASAPHTAACVAKAPIPAGGSGRMGGQVLVLSSSLHLKQPPAFTECRKINSRRGIPSPRAIMGTELQSDLLVAIRNP